MREEKNRLSEKVCMFILENYYKFNRIDNDGKYLLDFVTTVIGIPTITNGRLVIHDYLSPWLK